MSDETRRIGAAAFLALLVMYAPASAEGLILLAPPTQSIDKSKSAPLPLPPLSPPQSQAPAAVITPAPIAPLTEKPAPITVLPQVAVPSRSESSPYLEGLNFPGIMAALLADKGMELPDIRDVRRYTFSVYASMAELCGAHGDMASLDAAGYVEPGLGPGRDAGEVGARVGMQLLLGLAQVHKTGDVNTFLRNSSNAAPQVTEGQDDGRLITSRMGCASNDYNSLKYSIERLIKAKTGSDPRSDDRLALAALMSPSFRTRNGVEDPAVTLRNRKIEASTKEARKLCVGKYEETKFCDCILSRLKSHALDEKDWETIGSGFTKIVQVAVQKPAVAQTIRTCVRER